MISREQQEQSIKARKHELFQEEQPVTGEPLRSFSEYVDKTPAAPLSGGDKAILGGVGAVVVLLFFAAVYAWIQGPRHRMPAAPPKATASAPLR